MSYIAILKVNASTKRVEKFQPFSTEEEAEAHVQKFIGTYPLAYCAEEPDGSSVHWLCDTSAKTIVISKLVDPDNPEWKKNRQLEYPSIGDQLDMQYWDKINNTAIWADLITKIKSDNPKE